MKQSIETFSLIRFLYIYSIMLDQELQQASLTGNANGFYLTSQSLILLLLQRNDVI